MWTGVVVTPFCCDGVLSVEPVLNFSDVLVVKLSVVDLVLPEPDDVVVLSADVVFGSKNNS